RMSGISFEHEEMKFKGSQLGREYSWAGLQKKGLNYESNRDYDVLKRAKECTKDQMKGNVSNIANKASPIIKTDQPRISSNDHIGRESIIKTKQDGQKHSKDLPKREDIIIQQAPKESSRGIGKGQVCTVQQKQTPQKSVQAINTYQPRSQPHKSVVDEYKAEIKRLYDRYGTRINLSKADGMICKEMVIKGYDPNQIKEAILEASPRLEERKKGHVQNYIRHTVDKAMTYKNQQPPLLSKVPEENRDKAAQQYKKEGEALETKLKTLKPASYNNYLEDRCFISYQTIQDDRFKNCILAAQKKDPLFPQADENAHPVFPQR
ncbi:MAG: hypothetical protein GY718_13215, partial [Lentisphaerae bacterium]|nr:hypothetical protein [Lentisphaerota bacterium]